MKVFEYFDSFEELKKHLVENDYFGWIKDNEPERSLPDFSKVCDVTDIEAIFEEFDYDWFTAYITEIN